MSLLLLSLNEVKQSITMHQAIDAMERAFIQLAATGNPPITHISFNG